MGIANHIIDNPSIQASVVVGLITGILFTLSWRFVIWPMVLRRQQHPLSSRRGAWETAFMVGVIGWLVAWNILVFGFDAGFGVTILSSIAAGIVVTLLVHQVIVSRKPPQENVRE